MHTEPKRRGRPPMPPEERQETRVVLMMDRGLRDALAAVARQEARSTSGEARVAIMRHLAAHAAQANGGAGAVPTVPAAYGVMGTDPTADTGRGHAGAYS
jgi:hypothetical protein